MGWSGRAVVVFRLRVGLGDKPLPLLLQGAADGFLFFFGGGAARCDLLEIKAHAGVVHFAADADGQGLAFGVAFEADVFGDFVAGKVELAAAGHGGGGPGKRGLGAVAADAVLDVGFQHKMAERHGGGFGFGRAVADAGEQVADAVEADARPFAVVNIQFHAAVEAGEHFVGAAALRGSGSSSSAVCDEYEKAFAEATKDVDAATKDMMQKSFEQTKEALKNLPADQRDATCKTSLDALKGVPAAETPEDKAVEAKDAAEDAKEEAK